MTDQKITAREFIGLFTVVERAKIALVYIQSHHAHDIKLALSKADDADTYINKVADIMADLISGKNYPAGMLLRDCNLAVSKPFVNLIEAYTAFAFWKVPRERQAALRAKLSGIASRYPDINPDVIIKQIAKESGRLFA